MMITGVRLHTRSRKTRCPSSGSEFRLEHLKERTQQRSGLIPDGSSGCVHGFIIDFPCVEYQLVVPTEEIASPPRPVTSDGGGLRGSDTDTDCTPCSFSVSENSVPAFLHNGKNALQNANQIERDETDAHKLMYFPCA